MSEKVKKKSARERIVESASELFYRQGYRATGINQIIAESGVAKASFYSHFPSKEDLLNVYASMTSELEINEIRTEVLALPSARERLFGPLTILTPWFEVSEYRGCPFQLLIAEAPPEASRVRDITRAHREKLRNFMKELIRDLAIEDSTLNAIDIDELAGIYLVLLEGAIATAVAYRDPWPVNSAIQTLTILLNHYRH